MKAHYNNENVYSTIRKVLLVTLIVVCSISANASHSEFFAPPISITSNTVKIGATSASTTVVFEVVFDVAVKNVSTDDFELTVTTGTVSAAVSSVSASTGTSFEITVNNIDGNGDIRLDLLNTNNITETDNTGSIGSYNSGAQHTVAVDTDAPAVQSIVVDGSPAAKDASIDFTVTFDEVAFNVSTDDFSLAKTGTANGSISSVSAATGSSVTVTVNSISGTGTLGLNLRSGRDIDDEFNNSGPDAFTGSTHTVDRDAPTVSSINIVGNPAITANQLSYTVTFSESVTNVTSGGFNLSGATGSLVITEVSSTQYTVAVSLTSGTGTMELEVTGGIKDNADNVVVAYSSGPTRQVDVDPPVVTGITVVGSPAADATSVDYLVLFDENANNIDISDFELSVTGDILGSLSSIQNSSGGNLVPMTPQTSTNSVTVTVNDIFGGGSIGINLRGNTNIVDALGNGNNSNGYVQAYTAGEKQGLDNSGPSDFIVTLIPDLIKIGSTPTQPQGFTLTGAELGTNMRYAVASYDPITLASQASLSYNWSSDNGALTTTNPAVDFPQAFRDALVEGIIVLDVFLTDGNGNTGRKVDTILMDLTRPIPNLPNLADESDLGLSNQDNITSDNTPTFNGVTEKNSLVAVKDGSTTLGTVEANEQGEWGFTSGNLANGSHSISVVVTDPAGNVSNPPSGNQSLSITIDTTEPDPPSLALSSESDTGIQGNNITSVTTPTFEGTTIANANVQVRVNGSIIGTDQADDQGAWSLTLSSPIDPGTYTITAVATSPAGQASDPASINVTINTSTPTVSISSTESSPTKTILIPIKVTFNEPVTGFVVGDLVVTGGQISSFTGSEAAYTFNITPSAEGSIKVNIAAGTASDLAGNANSVADEYSITHDVTQPAVVIGSILTNPTSENPITISAIFSEPVTGFTADDLVIKRDGQTLQTSPIINFEGSGDTYTFYLTPTVNGIFSIEIPAGAVIDAAENDNTSSNTFSITYNTDAPQITISDNVDGPSTNISPIPIMVTFSIDVTGFDVTDLDVTGGVISDFSGSGTTYTFKLTPIEDGEMTINIAAAVAEDAAKNANIPAEQYSITYDTQSPTVIIGSRANNPTNSSPIPITFLFNEPIKGFNANSFIVTSGSLGAIPSSGTASGSGEEYTVNVSPSVDTLRIDMEEAGVTDIAGNPIIVGEQFSIVYDIEQPIATITSSESNPTNSRSIPIRVAFNETVSGFTVEDLIVTGGVVDFFKEGDSDNLDGEDSIYTFEIRPPVSGIVTVNIGASVAVDEAGNLNSAASQFSITYDQTLPSAVISSSEPSPTKSKLIPVTITFSEKVNGFEANDLDITGGTGSNFVNLEESGTIFTFDFTPSTDGSVVVSIAPNVAEDDSGNGNVIVAPFTIIHDSVLPSSIITSLEDEITNLKSIPMTITFSEIVTGLRMLDFRVTGGSARKLTGSGKEFTFELIPTNDGLVSVYLSSAATSDLAGNLNNTSEKFSIIHDSTLPTVNITSTSQSPTNTSPIPMTVTFSEAVTGLGVGDLNVAGGSVSNLSGSGVNYTFDLIPNADGEITVDLPEGSVSDNAGNGNVAATQYSINFDAASSPTVTISSTVLNPTRMSPIPIVVTFNETVTGFEETDLNVSGGVVSNFSGSGTTYKFDLTPNASGLLTVDIPSSAAVDNIGNQSLAASQFSITYDVTSPIPTISSTIIGPTRVSPIPIKVTFDKIVNGFSDDDLTITGGAVSNLVGSGATYNFDLVPSTDGEITINITADVANDALGNNNSAAEEFSIVFDNSSPSVLITSSETSPTGISPILINVTFSESVSGFSSDDLIVTGGTISSFGGSGSVYTFNLSPSGVGMLTIDVAASAAVDVAGNSNEEAEQFQIAYEVSSAAQITSFSIPQASAPPRIEAGIITFELEDGTDVTALVPTISISENATISPQSGVPQNFSQPVTYTVTAENRTTVQIWTVSLVNGTILGIAESEQIEVFPNPVKDQLTVPLRMFNHEAVTILITNMSGQETQRKTINGLDEVVLDVHDYHPGMYILRIEHGDKLFYSRFIKF